MNSLKLIKAVVSAVVCTAAIAVSSIAVSAADWYVSPSGSDSNAGTHTQSRLNRL